MPSKKLQVLIFLVLAITCNAVQIGQEKIPEPATNISQVVINKPMIVEINTNKIITVKPKKITFNPNNINEISNISYEDLLILLKNTGMEDMTAALIQSEQEYGINALFLVGLIALESGWEQSNRARRTNKMGGVAVYSNMSRGAVYKSKGESVLHIAKFIRRDYLNEDGLYHNGTSIWNINTHYCIGKNWSKNIINIINELLAKISISY